MIEVVITPSFLAGAKVEHHKREQDDTPSPIEWLVLDVVGHGGDRIAVGAEDCETTWLLPSQLEVFRARLAKMAGGYGLDVVSGELALTAATRSLVLAPAVDNQVAQVLARLSDAALATEDGRWFLESTRRDYPEVFQVLGTHLRLVAKALHEAEDAPGPADDVEPGCEAPRDLERNGARAEGG